MNYHNINGIINVISNLGKNIMLVNFDDLIYFLFAAAVIAAVLYIGLAFGKISDDVCGKENSNIFKKTFQNKYKEK